MSSATKIGTVGWDGGGKGEYDRYVRETAHANTEPPLGSKAGRTEGRDGQGVGVRDAGGTVSVDGDLVAD